MALITVFFYGLNNQVMPDGVEFQEYGGLPGAKQDYRERSIGRVVLTLAR